MPKKVLLIIWLALCCTVPWWFLDSDSLWFGFPAWVTYAIISAIIYSCLLGFIIQKYWKTKDNAK